jgi:hypothetical protein
LGNLSVAWYSLVVAERKGFIMASSTFTITRVAVHTDGTTHSTVEPALFSSKREAEKYLGLSLYFPYVYSDKGEKSVRFVIKSKRR